MKSKNLSIVHVTPYFPPHLGGIENAVFQIAKKQADKYPVFVITTNLGVIQEVKPKQPFHVDYLNAVELAHTPIIFRLFPTLMEIPQNSIIHVHISQALTPEIVMLVSKLRKIPFVAHVHLDVDPSGKLGFLLKPYKKIFLSRVLRNATKVICLTKMQKEQIKLKYKIDAGKLTVVPNGVGSEYFMSSLHSQKNVTKLLYVGRLAPQKNLSLLLLAISLLKSKVQVDIVGDGEEQENLEKLAKEHKLSNVNFHGRKTPEEIVKFYKDADLFVITSQKEGFSLSILEAMAAGLPIVAPDVSGVNEMLKDCAVLVSSPTPASFANALDNTIKDIALRKKLSKIARLKAQKFTWEKAEQKLEKIYREVQYGNK